MVNLTTWLQFFRSSKIFSQNSTGFLFSDSPSHFLGLKHIYKVIFIISYFFPLVSQIIFYPFKFGEIYLKFCQFMRKNINAYICNLNCMRFQLNISLFWNLLFEESKFCLNRRNRTSRWSRWWQHPHITSIKYILAAAHNKTFLFLFH